MGAIDEGGLTHINYAHFYFPRVIQTVCPKCKKESLLINIDAPEEVAFFIDVAPYKQVWRFICCACTHRELMSWEEIKKVDLLNKITIRNETIWAWNVEHLDYLIGVFTNQPNKNHKWAAYGKYIKKEWMTKTKNKSDIKKLIEMKNKFQQNFSKN